MLIDLLKWRYATKKMNPEKTVPDAKIEAILDAIRLAPTSSGLQPFEAIVVTDPGVRAQLAEAGYGQQQFNDGSHVIVFAAWDDYTAEKIDMVRDETAAARGGITDRLRDYYENLKGNYTSRDAAVNFEHAARQTYIALGLALAAAAEQQVDATPMEGFENDKVDAILGLRERGLKSTVLICLGYRAEDGDWLKDAPKVRRAPERLFRRVG